MRWVRSERLLGGFLGSLALWALGLSQVQADIITQNQSVTNNGNGTYTWAYTANTALDQTVTKGDYFSILDFKGFTGAHSEPAGWTFSSSFVGPVPQYISVKDDPTLANMTWTYTGTGGLTGPVNLGQFTADSTIGAVGPGTFVGVGTRTDGLLANTKIANFGTESVPLVTTSPVPAGSEIPEPTALAVLGVGLPVALGVWLRRRRKATA